jgi:hypothetical protein
LVDKKYYKNYKKKIIFSHIFISSMSFQQKYLKYKQKYLVLKRKLSSTQTGGANTFTNLTALSDTPVSDVEQKGGASLFPEAGFVDMRQGAPVEGSNVTTTDVSSDAGTSVAESSAVESSVVGAIEDANSEPASIDTEATAKAAEPVAEPVAEQAGGAFMGFSEIKNVFTQMGGLHDDSSSSSDSSLSDLSSVSSSEFDL